MLAATLRLMVVGGSYSYRLIVIIGQSFRERGWWCLVRAVVGLLGWAL